MHSLPYGIASRYQIVPGLLSIRSSGFVSCGISSCPEPCIIKSDQLGSFFDRYSSRECQCQCRQPSLVILWGQYDVSYLFMHPLIRTSDEIDDRWSTTVKSVEKSNFFLQMPIIWRRFWRQLLFFTACLVSIRAFCRTSFN